MVKQLAGSSGLVKSLLPGSLLRLPLRLLSPTMTVRIIYGALHGKKWIVGSAIHRCWLGLYEHAKQRLIVREVRENTVFWDVGANVGFYTLLASMLVGSGKVFAFEPVPRNLSYLKKHLALNEVVNAEVLPLAISDKNGSSSFETEDSGFMGRLSDQGRLLVSTATLDGLVDEGKVLPPDYVKIDIEGAELFALRGARQTFQRFHPTLFLATHGRQVERECCELLESWGYEWQCIQGASGELGEIFARHNGNKHPGTISERSRKPFSLSGLKTQKDASS